MTAWLYFFSRLFCIAHRALNTLLAGRKILLLRRTLPCLEPTYMGYLTLASLLLSRTSFCSICNSPVARSIGSSLRRHIVWLLQCTSPSRGLRCLYHGSFPPYCVYLVP